MLSPMAQLNIKEVYTLELNDNGNKTSLNKINIMNFPSERPVGTSRRNFPSERPVGKLLSGIHLKNC